MSQDTWYMQEEVDKRERIARILQSTELLTWYAMNNNESVPQTRYRFKKQLCGMEESEDEWEDELASDQREEEEAKKRRAKAGKKAEKEGAASSSGSKRKSGASSKG